jgi:GT2 family glycosyltransferase
MSQNDDVRVSPDLIAQLNALASRLTQMGEYEAVDLIDTAASRLSEMDAEIKRLREIESFAQTAARWSNPERRHPHTIVSADEMLKAIWGHPSRAALEHQP